MSSHLPLRKDFVFNADSYPLNIDLMSKRHAFFNISSHSNPRTYSYELIRSARRSNWLCSVIDGDSKRLKLLRRENLTHCWDTDDIASALRGWAQYCSSSGASCEEPTLLLIHRPAVIFKNPYALKDLSTIMSKGRRRLVFPVFVGNWEELEMERSLGLPALGLVVNVGLNKLHVVQGTSNNLSHPSLNAQHLQGV